MKKKLVSAIIGICSLGAPDLKAQDLHFSQFYETTILRNPALTGIFEGEYKVSAIYRNQWSSISKPFQTAVVSAETRIPVNDVNDFLSIGLLAHYDKAGSIDLKSVAIYPAINYNKSLGDDHNSYLSVGFTGGYIQRSYDPSKMTFDNQYQNGGFSPDNSTGESIPDSKITNWDLGAGISFSSGSGSVNDVSYFAGISAYHFTRPRRSFFNNSLVRLEMRWNATAGLNYKLNENYGLLIHANYTLQGVYNEIIGGGLVSWRKAEDGNDPLFTIYAGAFYRFQDALIPTLKLDYHDFSFGMSYDVNVSKLKAASNLKGGYELSVIKTGLFNDPKWEKSRTICPHF